MNLLLLAEVPAEEIQSLTTAGWATMLISVGSVLTLVSFCLLKVLSLPPVEEQSLKGPLEIDTGDTEDAD